MSPLLLLIASLIASADAQSIPHGFLSPYARSRQMDGGFLSALVNASTFSYLGTDLMNRPGGRTQNTASQVGVMLGIGAAIEMGPAMLLGASSTPIGMLVRAHQSWAAGGLSIEMLAVPGDSGLRTVPILRVDAHRFFPIRIKIFGTGSANRGPHPRESMGITDCEVENCRETSWSAVLEVDPGHFNYTDVETRRGGGWATLIRQSRAVWNPQFIATLNARFPFLSDRASVQLDLEGTAGPSVGSFLNRDDRPGRGPSDSANSAGMTWIASAQASISILIRSRLAVDPRRRGWARSSDRTHILRFSGDIITSIGIAGAGAASLRLDAGIRYFSPSLGASAASPRLLGGITYTYEALRAPDISTGMPAAVGGVTW